MVAAKDGVTAVPASPIQKLVDTTGAGDLFAAGFLFGLVRNAGYENAGRLGALAAAEVIQHIGARPQVSLKESGKAEWAAGLGRVFLSSSWPGLTRPSTASLYVKNVDARDKPGHDGVLCRDFVPHAVFAAFNPSFVSTASRIKNFWIFPVTVIGNSSTNST